MSVKESISYSSFETGDVPGGCDYIMATYVRCMTYDSKVKDGCTVEDRDWSSWSPLGQVWDSSRIRLVIGSVFRLLIGRSVMTYSTRGL